MSWSITELLCRFAEMALIQSCDGVKSVKTGRPLVHVIDPAAKPPPDSVAGEGHSLAVVRAVDQRAITLQRGEARLHARDLGVAVWRRSLPRSSP